MNPEALAARLADLLKVHLRSPIAVEVDGNGNPLPVWAVPLTGPEQAVYDRLLRIARSTVPSITPAEWQALEPDIAGLATYQGLASPTLAQTVLAVKAQSRILRALLRD